MINIRNKQEIDGIRSAAIFVSDTFHEIADLVHAGTMLSDIDHKAEIFILKNGGETLYKGIHQRPHQRPFPGVICTSLNNQICHGIPDSRILKEGDIVGIDIGLRYKGWCGDACFTYKIGRISSEANDLVDTSHKCLEKGINACEAGKPLGVIGAAIQKLAENRGYSVVREYGGHGIGRELWEEPFVPHIGPADRGVRLREGMVINIEPMINIGMPETRLMPDEWSVETADGSLSSQFEHTIVITDHGPEILTRL